MPARRRRSRGGTSIAVARTADGRGRPYLERRRGGAHIGGCRVAPVAGDSHAHRQAVRPELCRARRVGRAAARRPTQRRSRHAGRHGGIRRDPSRTRRRAMGFGHRQDRDEAAPGPEADDGATGASRQDRRGGLENSEGRYPFRRKRRKGRGTRAPVAAENPPLRRRKAGLWEGTEETTGSARALVRGVRRKGRTRPRRRRRGGGAYPRPSPRRTTPPAPRIGRETQRADRGARRKHRPQRAVRPRAAGGRGRDAVDRRGQESLQVRRRHCRGDRRRGENPGRPPVPARCRADPLPAVRRAVRGRTRRCPDRRAGARARTRALRPAHGGQGRLCPPVEGQPEKGHRTDIAARHRGADAPRGRPAPQPRACRPGPLREGHPLRRPGIGRGR